MLNRIFLAALAFGLGSIFYVVWKRAFLFYVPVWPDEVFMSGPALSFFEKGHFGTDVLNGLVPATELYSYWYFPFYFFYVACFYAVFSVKIEVLRISSLVAVSLLVTLGFVLLAKVSNRSWGGALLACALMMDPLVFRSSMLGRVEPLVWVFMITSMFCYFGGADAFFVGMLAGLGLLCHPIGIGFLLPLFVAYAVAAIQSSHGRLKRSFWHFASGVCLIFVPWLIAIAFHPDIFWSQFAMQLANKASESAALSWSEKFRFFASQYQGFEPSVVYLLWIFGGLGAALWALQCEDKSKRSKSKAWVLFTSLILMSALAFQWGSMWYAIYPTVAAWMGLALGCSALTSLQNRFVRYLGFALTTGLMAVVVVTSVRFYEQLYDRYDADYQTLNGCQRWASPIIEAIPQGSTVLIDVVPDPFFAIRTAGRADLKVIYFDGGAGGDITSDRYLKHLERADYAIVGDDFNSPDRPVKEWFRSRGSLKISVTPSRGYSAFLIQRQR